MKTKMIRLEQQISPLTVLTFHHSRSNFPSYRDWVGKLSYPKFYEDCERQIKSKQAIKSYH